MPRRTELLAALAGPALSVPLLVVPAAPSVADGREVPSSVAFTFSGEEVFESSGLVDRGAVVYTTNDSGDEAVLYGVDPGTGATVSRTSYAADVEDVEALAPGARGTVWAGDIGDNQRRRDDVVVFRVRPVDGEDPAPAYRLTYPDGPHDAETLLARPATQRLFVVSKSPLGGTVYIAPRRLSEDGENRLRPFARVRGLVTDGTFLPGGRRVLLRTYDSASVYTFPAFELLGTVRLPYQQQGEGISAGAGGRVLVSTEGVRADVLRVRLSPALLRGPAPSAGSAQDPRSRRDASPAPEPRADDSGPARDPGDWAGIGLVAAGIAGVAYLAARGSRRLGAR